jgi:hypothetical protein
MIHPSYMPRAGELYRLVLYLAKLLDKPRDLPPDEVQGIIALTREQVIQGLECKPTVADLISKGASLTAGEKHINPQLRLYPLGTARALAQILRNIAKRGPKDSRR